MYITRRNRDVHIHIHPLTPPQNIHTDYHQEMDMPGWEITTESTKANPAPAATIDSWKVCIINATIREKKKDNHHDFLQKKCILCHRIKNEVSRIEWFSASTMYLGKKDKVLSIELTVAVAYVGPEPSMKIRPLSKAWSITFTIQNIVKLQNKNFLCHGKVRLNTNYEMLKDHHKNSAM